MVNNRYERLTQVTSSGKLDLGYIPYVSKIKLGPLCPSMKGSNVRVMLEGEIEMKVEMV